jgi:YfiH family protein
MTLSLIRPEWPAPAHVRAATTTRTGGVSKAPFESLNLGKASGDEAAAVAENRRRLSAALDLPSPPSWLRQVHGPHVVRAPFASPDETPEADAAFTTETGVVCVVQTADCLPVLFCDDAGSTVAAAHAGWRGLAAGVLEATIAALPAKADQLMAWLGPAIGPQAFEVGPDVREAFAALGPEAVAAFRPQAEQGKWLCDIYALARLRLRAAGIGRISGGGLCTHTDSARFFSYRRDGRCGRMASLVWLEAGASSIR